MIVKKNFYYNATVNGLECELAVRSDFKCDFTPDDYCIAQTRRGSVNGVVTHYLTMTRRELKAALGLPAKSKIEIME